MNTVDMKQAILTERQRLTGQFLTIPVPKIPNVKVLAQFQGQWIIGMCSATNRKNKLRYVKHGEYIQVGNPLIGSLLLTYTDINYTYLELHNQAYPGQRNNRLSKRQRLEFEYNLGTHPIYATPFEGEAIYLDLKAFHANVLLAFGRDMDYLPGKDGYIDKKPAHEDYPFWENKEARNRLHSTAYGGTGIITYYNEKTKARDLPQRWQNLALIRFTHDLSTAIGYKMIHEGGAIYANRDGYIVPYGNRRAAFDALDRINIPYAIKQAGHCSIRGYGNYDFVPNLFDQNGHIAKSKSRSFNTHLPDLDHATFWRLVGDTFHDAPNLLRPTYSSESLSELNRLRA